jgi:RNA polymerase sigma-70 factor, ECF subfamily
MHNRSIICCREVLGKLLQQYAPMVRSICARRLGCNQCDDLQQEAFLRVIKSCHRVRDARQLPGYLRTITVNLCSDRLRAHRSRPHLYQADADLLDNLPDPIEDGTENGMENGTAQLREEIDQLPLALRDPLELFYFSSMDYEAIAKRTGLTVGAVGQRLSRARRRLRQALAFRRRAG